MSSSPNIVLKQQTMRDVADIKDSEFVAHDCKRDKDKLSRIKSSDSIPSMDNFDVSESNILSSLFDGIPMNHNHTNKPGEDTHTPRMQCVNVISRAKQRSNAIVMATGLREPDEMRIIFKKRPLGIQIKPVNFHGYGAKISKIINHAVCDQGVEENMIITGLNNKDLLGCTFDQIMTIMKAADLPITLRLLNNNALPQMNALQLNSSTYSSSSHSLTSPVSTIGHCNGRTRARQRHIGPQRDKLQTRTPRMYACDAAKSKFAYDVNSLEPPSLTPKDNLMLASFSVENMPTTTILSSSSDEDGGDCMDGSLAHDVIQEQMESDVDDEESEEDEYGMSYVQWSNIRLGASVIKYGWALDIDDDEDETTFELAYDTLTRQGLNIYEIRAAIRLIRQQPEQIPPLETFKQLTIHNKRTVHRSVNPKFMPQQWLKETNLTIETTDEDADDEEEEDAEEEEGRDALDEDDDEGKEPGTPDSSCDSSLLSTGPSTTSLQNELKRMEHNSNNIYFDTFMNLALNPVAAPPNEETIANGNGTIKPKEAHKLYISSSYNPPTQLKMAPSSIQKQALSRSYSEKEYECKYISQPIAGYIDFFDDNESSSESESSSQSIELQEAMDAIGLKSPCPDIVLYSSDEDEEEEACKDQSMKPIINKNIKNKTLDFEFAANGALMVIGRGDSANVGCVVETPDGHYVDEYDEYEYDDYSTDCMESDEKVIDGIGVSSYICTEGADDLLENECLPQVMLKYVRQNHINNEEGTGIEEEKTKEESENGFKLLHHLHANNRLMGLKNSIRGLSIKTNVKSIFKKISPRITPLSVHKSD